MWSRIAEDFPPPSPSLQEGVRGKWSLRGGGRGWSQLLFGICFLLSSCTSDPKFKQYFAEGEQLYIKHCSNCHQKSGKGLGLVYPPLAPSDYMDNEFDAVLCLMKKGKTGVLLVNGKTYNMAMPGVPSLTELEIAEIATFIYNSWDRQRGLIDVKQASESLRPCLSN